MKTPEGEKHALESNYAQFKPSIKRAKARFPHFFYLFSGFNALTPDT